MTLVLNLLVSAGRVSANYTERLSFEYFALTAPPVNLMWISVYYFTIQLILIRLAYKKGTSEKVFSRVKIFMWVSIGQAIVYNFVLMYAEYSKNYLNESKKYDTTNVVLVCIMKIIKFVNDTIIHYLFFNFLIFFLNFR